MCLSVLRIALLGLYGVSDSHPEECRLRDLRGSVLGYSLGSDVLRTASFDKGLEPL